MAHAVEILVREAITVDRIEVAAGRHREAADDIGLLVL